MSRMIKTTKVVKPTKKTTKVVKTRKAKPDIPPGLVAAFSALKKMNTDSAPLTDNALSIVKEYIDSGCYALNAIMSGSFYRGFPKGRITGLVAPSGAGKTFIVNQAIANAQKKDPNVWAVVWDSENAFDAQMAKSLGANVNRIQHCPVQTVEECRNQMFQFLENIGDDPSLHGKIIIVLDSLGNLASTKELEDAMKGKSATDMGTKAKAIKSMMRVLTSKCAKTNTTMLFTNHIYDDPTSIFPTMVKNQAGGRGPVYLASLLVQLSLTQEKKETKDNDQVIAISNNIKGISMRAMTVKNRFVPPFLTTKLHLNFKTGLFKYTGLLEMAVAYNVVLATGSTYTLADGTKLGYYKNWKNNAKLWEEKIIPPLNEIIEKEFSFSNETSQDGIDDHVDYIEGDDTEDIEDNEDNEDTVIDEN